MLKKMMFKYIDDKFNIQFENIDAGLDDTFILALTIYLFDNMQDIGSEKLLIELHSNNMIVKCNSEIQLNNLEGYKQLLHKDIIYRCIEENTYDITNIVPKQQMCLLPLLYPKKFKGFIAKDVSRRFENVLLHNGFTMDTANSIEDKMRQTTEYKMLLSDKLSNIKNIVFNKQKEEHKSAIRTLREQIEDTNAHLKTLYARLQQNELALFGCSAKENDIGENIDDLIDVITSSKNIEVIDISNDALQFSVTGYYSIWRSEYLQTTLQRISSLAFVQFFTTAWFAEQDEAEKFYRLIFEKRRIKIKVKQCFYLQYSNNSITGAYKIPSDNGISNIHIGTYDCWDESKHVIYEYLNDYRYAEAVMQTINSAYTINLYDTAVMNRLAEELYNSKDMKLLVDSKTNEELTVVEAIKKIAEGEYDEDII